MERYIPQEYHNKGENMYLNTARIPWYSLREAVAADDTAITVFKYSNFPAVGALLKSGQNGSVDLNSPELMDANGLFLAAWGAGGNNKAITGYKLLGVTRQNGPIITVLSGVMTSGNLNCAVHPLTGATLTSNKWVDTITVTGGLFSGMVEILDSASDRICMLKFDTTILDKIFLEYDEDGSGMTAFNAMICGY
jgi:hypothetical protein